MQKRNNIVFYLSILSLIPVVLGGLIIPDICYLYARKLLDLLVSNFGWFYLISVFSFVVLAIFLTLSRYKDIKLGPDDSKPEYSFFSWFAMLFAAGMGIGLVFWGVAEPLNHYIYPPAGIEPGSSQSANFAIQTSFFHWGIHPWACYGILALALAYFQFRKNQPALISSIFIPLIGKERANGPIGIIIDIFTIVASVAGIATSFGLGTLQINSGLNYLVGISDNNTTHIIIILIITTLFLLSAITGLNRGIKWLSNINLSLACLLLIVAILIGPTANIFNAFSSGVGAYLGSFVKKSLTINAFADHTWLNSWTIFYWAWWIACAPFASTFIARISRGRTIKEFLIGVVLVPTLGCFFWFATFGTLGINLGPEVAQLAVQKTETALFVVFNQYPFGAIMSFISIFLLAVFFITTADSATFVLSSISSGGTLHPATRKKIIWGAILSLVAMALLLSGGLEALQIGSIAAAFPFAIIMFTGCFSLLKALSKDNFIKRQYKLKDSILNYWEKQNLHEYAPKNHN